MKRLHSAGILQRTSQNLGCAVYIALPHAREQGQAQAAGIVGFSPGEIAGTVAKMVTVPWLEMDRDVVNLGTNPGCVEPLENCAPPWFPATDLRYQQMVRGSTTGDLSQEPDLLFAISQEIPVPLHKLATALHEGGKFSQLRKSQGTLDIRNAIIKSQLLLFMIPGTIRARQTSGIPGDAMRTKIIQTLVKARVVG
jgi:hypothetical protein